MRVVTLSTFREHCGLATYTRFLVDALHARGASVDVLAPHLATAATSRGDGTEEPLRLWSRERASVREALETFREIRRRGADVVHVQVSLGLFSPRFMLVLAQACRSANLPLVATLHERRGGDLRRELRGRRMHLALRGAALVVHNRQHAAELRGRPVQVIPHGVQLPVPRDLAAAKRELGLDPALPVVAHFGFVHPDKGIEEMLHAVAALRQRELPGLTYRVHGGTFPGSVSQRHLEQLRQLSRELGIADHVQLDGEFLSEAQLRRELAAADWIVLNYRSGNAQGTSGAARHAFVAGRPIAVSRAPIFDDVRGAVQTLERPLVQELPRLFADRPLQAELTERARASAETESWSHVAERHLELFERLVARHRLRGRGVLRHHSAA